MTVNISTDAYAGLAKSVAMSQLLTVTSGGNPAYLVVSAMDRNEYTVSSTGATGAFSENGNTANFGQSSVIADERAVGITFQWNEASGTYVNATYGNVANLVYTMSTNSGDLTDISFFGASDATDAALYAASSDIMSANSSTYSFIGTASFATQPAFTASVPTAATPDSVCAVAMNFVGAVWNNEGCFMLANTIADEAGASLAVATDNVQTTGVANGEWQVAYNGPTAQNANWLSLVQAGDVIVVGNANGGHVTTCVSGSGSTAMLVDNNSDGMNGANDGSSNDINIEVPHTANAEIGRYSGSDVVIYRLNTPTIQVASSSMSVNTGVSLSLASLFTTTDWAGTAISAYQVYDSNGSVAGVGISAATSTTLNSLVGINFQSNVAAHDTIEVRAENASGYWGDWTALGVTTVVSAPAGPLPSQGTHTQYVIADNNGSLYAANTVSSNATPTFSGHNVVAFTDGLGLFDPTGTAENVARIYLATVGRAPDVAGLEYWTAQVDNSNVPLSAVANSFVSSPEFIQDYGALSNGAFVNQLYENVLGRAADTAGAQYWNGVMQSGGSRGAVVLGLAESQENKADTISTAGDANNAEAYRLYQAALGRAPDASGLSYWSATLSNGTTSTQVAQDFINSTEFNQNGAMSASDFVNTLYQNVLHRAADVTGLHYWTNAMQTGTSEASVLVGFSDGLENRAQTAGATHANWVFIPG